MSSDYCKNEERKKTHLVCLRMLLSIFALDLKTKRDLFFFKEEADVPDFSSRISWFMSWIFPLEEWKFLKNFQSSVKELWALSTNVIVDTSSEVYRLGKKYTMFQIISKMRQIWRLTNVISEYICEDDCYP